MKLSIIAIVLATCIVPSVAADDSDAPELKKIHLVYMTHLDLGFTDTTRNVCGAFSSFTTVGSSPSPHKPRPLDPCPLY
jgi:hypothetical protein